jgi:hypothetical protein
MAVIMLFSISILLPLPSTMPPLSFLYVMSSNLLLPLFSRFRIQRFSSVLPSSFGSERSEKFTRHFFVCDYKRERRMLLCKLMKILSHLRDQLGLMTKSMEKCYSLHALIVSRRFAFLCRRRMWKKEGKFFSFYIQTYGRKGVSESERKDKE